MGIMFWFLPGLVFPLVGTVLGGVTLVVMGLLNMGGGGREGGMCLVGRPEGREVVNDERELWFFVNGVATGYVSFFCFFLLLLDYWVWVLLLEVLWEWD